MYQRIKLALGAKHYADPHPNSLKMEELFLFFNLYSLKTQGE